MWLNLSHNRLHLSEMEKKTEESAFTYIGWK